MEAVIGAPGIARLADPTTCVAPSKKCCPEGFPCTNDMPIRDMGRCRNSPVPCGITFVRASFLPDGSIKFLQLPALVSASSVNSNQMVQFSLSTPGLHLPNSNSQIRGA